MSSSPFDVDYHPGLATRSPSFLARKRGTPWGSNDEANYLTGLFNAREERKTG